MDNQENIQEELIASSKEAKVMLSGRVSLDQKAFMDSLWDKSKGETFADAINKVRESYLNRAVTIEGLDLTADREFLNKCLSGIQTALKNINEKTEQHLIEQAYSVNKRIEDKDVLLAEAEMNFIGIVEDYKDQINALNADNAMYIEKIKEISDNLDNLNKGYLKLKTENTDKTLTINSLLEDKRGLTAELADNRAKTTELQNKINDLHQVEVDNTSLKEEKEKLKEEIRDNKSEISIINTKLESNVNERNKLEKELLDTKELLNITNEKLGEAISELAILSNTIENLKGANAKLSLDNSSYIEALNNIKEERSNKELEYKKSIIDLERDLEVKFNKKLEEALDGIKVKHESELNDLKEKLFIAEMELKKFNNNKTEEINYERNNN